MALARGRRTDRRIDYWPGFVDALSTLLLAIMFLLTVFVLAQFILSREISGKDEVLNRLNKGEDFAKVAREVSQDPSTASAGGDIIAARAVFVLRRTSIPFK